MRKLMVLAMLLGVAAFGTTGVALADHDPPDGPAVAPSFIGGTVSNRCDGGQKLDGVGGDITSGTYAFSFEGFGGSLTITVEQTAMGPTFTFESDHPSHLVTSIYVKGGPNGSNFYNYAGQPLGGLAHDDGLHSPLNSKNGKWYGLSHICVFTDKDGFP